MFYNCQWEITLEFLILRLWEKKHFRKTLKSVSMQYEEQFLKEVKKLKWKLLNQEATTIILFKRCHHVTLEILKQLDKETLLSIDKLFQQWFTLNLPNHLLLVKMQKTELNWLKAILVLQWELTQEIQKVMHTLGKPLPTSLMRETVFKTLTGITYT